jgi:hypothetical protein
MKKKKKTLSQRLKRAKVTMVLANETIVAQKNHGFPQ